MTDGASLPPYAPWCPRCRCKAQAATVCPACGLGLVGPEIERLAQTDARIAELEEERRALRVQLNLRSGISGPGFPGGLGATGLPREAAVDGALAGPPPQATVRARRSGLAGDSAPTSAGAPFPGADPLWSPAQASKPVPGSVPGVLKELTVRQVLLGLGAVCLLAAATAFLALVWTSLGAIAQAAVMVGLTALLFVVAVTVATRWEGRFGATAEAVAVIATGLALIDVVAGRTLHVPGLATMPARGYALLAAVVLVVAFAAVTTRCAQLRAPAVAGVAAAVLVVPIAIIRHQSSLLLMVATTASCVLAAGIILMVDRSVAVAPAFRAARQTARVVVVLALVIANAAAVITAALDAREWLVLALVPAALTVVADRMMGNRVLPVGAGLANNTGGQTGRIVASVGGLAAAWVVIAALHAVDFGMLLGLLGMGLLVVCARGMEPAAHRVLQALVPAGASMALAGYILALAQGRNDVILVLAVGATAVATTWSVAPRGFGIPAAARAPSAIAAVLFAAQAVTTAAWTLHEDSAGVAAGAALVGWSATAVAQVLWERDIRQQVALTGLGVAVAATGTAVAVAGPGGSLAALLSLGMSAAAGALAVRALGAPWPWSMSTVAAIGALGETARLLGASSALIGVVLCSAAALASAGAARPPGPLGRPPWRFPLLLATAICALAGLELASSNSGSLALALAACAAACVVLAIREAVLTVPATVLASAAWTAFAVWFGARVVEEYTLVPAVLALALGSWWLHRRSVFGSLVTLGPGLLLAAGPSVVFSLDGPVLRQVLVLALGGCVVVVGARLRLRALVIVGGGAVLVVAARLAGPEVRALPRWSTLTAAGLLLLGAGVRYEAQLHRARASVEWLSSLR